MGLRKHMKNHVPRYVICIVLWQTSNVNVGMRVRVQASNCPFNRQSDRLSIEWGRRSDGGGHSIYIRTVSAQCLLSALPNWLFVCLFVCKTGDTIVPIMCLIDASSRVATHHLDDLDLFTFQKSYQIHLQKLTKNFSKQSKCILFKISQLSFIQ